MKTRVLFVDDEPNVLQGLKRMLRGLRGEWEMAFVESAHKALEILDEETFDVLVTDMRMPGMDGAQLLREVTKKYPQIVRIVLSGHSDQELILRSVRPAHQYLSKPCDAEAVKATITRACALRELLGEEALKGVISKTDSLPSLPSLYQEIMAELNSQDASIQKAGEIISKDIGMTAKILQLVNSAFFGLPRHVKSPGQAVALLGLETINALVLSIQVFSQFDNKNISNKFLEQLWGHSMETGTAARALAKSETEDKMLVDNGFLAGLLHDVGKLVLAASFPEKYARALDSVKETNVPLRSAEAETFGTTHAEVGGYLMGLWGLSDPVVEAIAFHHNPGRCPGRKFTPLTAVHVANALEHEEGPDSLEQNAPEPDMNYLAELGMEDRLPEWREIHLKTIQKE